MRSPFAEAAAAHSAAVDNVFGEPLRLRPQRKAGRSGGTAGADTSRPTAEVVGTVQRQPAPVQRQGIGAQGATNLQLAEAKWHVSFDAVAALGLGAKAGDLVERLEPMPGEPAWLRLSEPLPIRGRVIHPAEEVTG